VMSRDSVYPIFVASMAILMGMILQSCSVTDRQAFIKATCEALVGREIDLKKGQALSQLKDKCKLKEEGAAEIDGVSKEEAEKVGDKCMGAGSREIEAASQEEYEQHLKGCIDKATIAGNGTNAGLTSLWQVISNYVNENKDEWGNKTGSLLDTAVNTGLDKANEVLEEERKKIGSDSDAADSGTEAKFSVQKVVTEVGSGSFLMMFNAAVALLAIGSAAFLASRRALRAIPQEQELELEEELQPTDSD